MRIWRGVTILSGLKLGIGGGGEDHQETSAYIDQKRNRVDLRSLPALVRIFTASLEHCQSRFRHHCFDLYSIYKKCNMTIVSSPAFSQYILF